MITTAGRFQNRSLRAQCDSTSREVRTETKLIKKYKNFSIRLTPHSKRTGLLKIFSLLLFTTLPLSLSCTPSLTLKTTTIDNIPLVQAGAGQPFLLHVAVANAQNTAQYPLIKGVDPLRVQLRQSGFQMNMVNGTTSVTYHYRVRIDDPGNYTLGPAQIAESGGIIESEPVTVQVGAEQKTNQAQKNTAASSTFMRLACDKISATVGQKIHCSLTFYTADPAVTLQTLIEPDQTTAYQIQNKQGPHTGTQTINGTQHRLAQWQWDLYPEKDGTCIIPAYGADFSTQTQNQMFSFFFGRNDTKRVYSNPITLTVAALPPSQEKPQLIGIVQEFTAKIEPTSARTGQGMVLTLTLTGDADFEHMAGPELQLPQELKWYESKKHTVPSKTDPATQVHTMEYIVQALQPGTHTIPAQTLFYFDTQEKKYRSKKTLPLSIHVSGTAPSAAKQTPETIQPVTAIKEADELPLRQEPWQPSAPWRIPWPLYAGTLMAAALFWLMYLYVCSRAKKPSSIFATARKQIAAAQQARNPAAFYTTFSNLLAAYLNVPAAHLTPEVIDVAFAQAGLVPAAIQDWHLFFAQLAQLAFYPQPDDQRLLHQITEKSYYWIDIIQKLPRGTA